MNRAITLGILVIFVGIFIVSSDGGISTQERHLVNETHLGIIIYVDYNNTAGPWDGTIDYPYQRLQDGIDHASSGDTVYVSCGAYHENIVIDKSIMLIGEGSSSTIIDGSYDEFVVNVIEDWVVIMNFTIRNSGGYIGDAGVKFNSNNNLIKNCIIYRTKTGIYLDNSSFNEIDNCTFHTNGGGVLLKTSDNNNIKGCSLSHNAIAIHFEHSTSNTISFSYLYANGIACFFEGSSNIEMWHCNISDNSVNIGGIFIIGCSDVSVTNCVICHNGAGVSISSSRGVSITGCDLYSNTHFAVLLRTTSCDIIVSECEIRDNFRFGIYLEKGNSCIVRNNNICDNTLYGIYSKIADCNAWHNWWGSHFGPSYTKLRLGDKITWIPGQIKFFPWLAKPLDGIGADWENNEPYMQGEIDDVTEKRINLSGDDSDGDGIPDWWEEKWGYNPSVWDDHANLDPDQDALNNFEECYTDQYGSNPFHKDIFLEFDWMESSNPNISNRPPIDLIESVITLFDEHDITLHVDLGDLGGGEEIPLICASNFSFAKLRDVYWDYFLHNDLTNPRKGIFHYGIICNYCPDLNFPFFGWDQFDSFAISAQWLKEKNPLMTRGQLIVGGAVHHLGHTLGLLADTHGGIDNLDTPNPFSLQWWKYRNYKSCMNYRYKYKLLTFSDGSNGKGDYDDWENLELGFFKNSHFEQSEIPSSNVPRYN